MFFLVDVLSITVVTLSKGYLECHVLVQLRGVEYFLLIVTVLLILAAHHRFMTLFNCRPALHKRVARSKIGNYTGSHDLLLKSSTNVDAPSSTSLYMFHS